MGELFLLLLVIFGIVLVWRGPKVLPGLGAMFGRGVRDVRRASRERMDAEEEVERTPSDR